ncbi:MAG: HD domain-containing protein [Xanthomonadales bacterium]|nr:HD domain-containing protein [Xanthomonadales bacterium]
MSYCSWKDRLYVMTVLMSDIGLDLESFIPAYSTLKLANRDGRWNAVAWPLLTLPSSSSTPTVCEVTVLDAREDPECEPLALVHWEPLDEIRLLDVLPDALCPIPGVVTQTCELVKTIHSNCLRRFMATVFRHPDVHVGFWRQPASLSHHHAYEGGLAQHSLEVAVAASSIDGLDASQRDMVVTYGLLHDLGKVWAYDEGQLRDEARQLGHQKLGYVALRPLLDQLRRSDRWSASSLTTLLSGQWKCSLRHPSSALGDIVRAMDRFSAARNVGNAARRSG